MPKLIKFGDEAIEPMLKGIDTVADAVGSTLGPTSSNVIITRKYETPTSTHDGVSVAKEISLSDPFEDAGAQMILQAASKTNDEAGDGTTTATILSRAIIQEGRKAIKSGYNPKTLTSEIQQTALQAKEILLKMAKPLKTREEKINVATISCADRELGTLIVDALEKAGDYGVVDLNETPIDGITVEHTEGMELDSGWISHYFVTDDKNNAAIADPYILITDQRLSSQQDIVPFIETVTNAGKKNLVIIADDIEGEALALLTVNKLKGNFNALAIRVPALGVRGKQVLEDIAVLSSGTVISEDTGRSLASVTLADLGRAERIISTRDKTRIINGHGTKLAIGARIKHLKAELDQADNEWDKDQISKRLAKLSSGVVVINVGGKTEVEMKETKFRIEDALCATKAAIEEGIVPGGETALMKVSQQIFQNSIGALALSEALKKPFLLLLDNAGITDGELIAKGQRATGNMGINVMTGQLTDLIKEGVIDPVKVSRLALANAVSVAVKVLITKVLIVDDPEEKNA